MFCVLSNNGIQSFLREVSYFCFGIAFFLIDKVRAILCIYRVDCVHRNTSIPILVMPIARANQTVLSCYRKCIRAFIACERIIIAVFIVHFIIFLLKRLRKNVHLRGFEFRFPYVACSIRRYDFINASVNRIDRRSFRIRFAVNRYGLDRRIYVGISIRPSEYHVAVRFAVGYVLNLQRLLGFIDYNRVIPRAIACIVNAVEYVFTKSVIFSTRHIRNKLFRVGKLDVTSFCTLKSNMPTICVTVVVNLDVIHVELSSGNLSIERYRVRIRAVSCSIHCIERIFAFRGIACSRRITHIAACVRTLYVNRCQTELVIRHETDTLRIGCRTVSNYCTSAIDSSSRFRFIKRNIHRCGNVT